MNAGHLRRDRHAERFSALETLWDESTLKSVRLCGKHPLSGGLVSVKASGTGATRAAGFGGLMTCGSVWACPECSAKIANTRKAELQEAQKEARRRGWVVSHLTLTMRHHKGQSLRELWSALSYAWGAVTSGRAWETDQSFYGVRGWVRVVEVTYGDRGWHVHIHALVFTDAQGFGRSPANLGPVLFQRWSAALKRKGMRAPTLANGVQVRVLGGAEDGMGDYFTKAVYASAVEDRELERLALEVARGDLKDARQGNRTPFRVLADVVELGCADDLALWHEWEQGSKGRHQLTWSHELRRELVKAPELSDAEIAAQDVGGSVVVLLPADTWRAVTRERGARAVLRSVTLLDDCGTSLRAYLRARGWAWVEPTPADPIDLAALAAKRAGRPQSL